MKELFYMLQHSLNLVYYEIRIDIDHKMFRVGRKKLGSVGEPETYNYFILALKLCTLYMARVTMLAYHIIHAPAEYRSRDLPVRRRVLYH